MKETSFSLRFRSLKVMKCNNDSKHYRKQKTIIPLIGAI